MQRSGSMDRMRWMRLQLAVQFFQSRKDAPHSHDGVTTVCWTAAVSCDTGSGYFDPLESFMADSNLHVRRFADDGGIGIPFRDQRVSTNARVLFIDDSSEN